MSNGPPIPPDPPPPQPFPPGTKTETRYAIVRDGVVVGFSYNIIERLVQQPPPGEGVTIVENNEAQVGWIDDGTGTLVPPAPLSTKTDPAERMMEEQREQHNRTLAFYARLASKQK